MGRSPSIITLAQNGGVNDLDVEPMFDILERLINSQFAGES